MQFIFLSNLYPTPVEPHKATFNARLINAIARINGLDSTQILAVNYWLPFFDSLIRKRKKPPKVFSDNNGLSIKSADAYYTPRIFRNKHHWMYRKSIANELVKLVNNSNDRTKHIMLGFIYPDAVAMAPICRQLGVNYSIRVNGSDFRHRIENPVSRKMVLDCLHKAPLIFCPGEILREDMIKEGIKPDKIHAFNNGIESELFNLGNRLNRNASEKASILFVGNLFEVKRPERLIFAFSNLSKRSGIQNLELNIIGDGPLRNELTSLVNSLDIKYPVIFHGRQGPETVASMMKGADCLCLCSRTEGMPNVIVEALACGCPVVATDVGEIPNLIRPNENGFIIPIDQITEDSIIDDLTEKLEMTLKAEWNHASISAGMKDYSWDTAASMILEKITA